jgi:hypothetical protein
MAGYVMCRRTNIMGSRVVVGGRRLQLPSAAAAAATAFPSHRHPWESLNSETIQNPVLK